MRLVVYTWACLKCVHSITCDTNKSHFGFWWTILIFCLSFPVGSQAPVVSNRRPWNNQTRKRHRKGVRKWVQSISRVWLQKASHCIPPSRPQIRLLEVSIVKRTSLITLKSNILVNIIEKSISSKLNCRINFLVLIICNDSMWVLK